MNLSLFQEYLSQYYADVGMTNSTTRRLVKKSFSQDLEAMQAFFGLEVFTINDMNSHSNGDDVALLCRGRQSLNLRLKIFVRLSTNPPGDWRLE